MIFELSKALYFCLSIRHMFSKDHNVFWKGPNVRLRKFLVRLFDQYILQKNISFRSNLSNVKPVLSQWDIYCMGAGDIDK